MRASFYRFNIFILLNIFIFCHPVYAQETSITFEHAQSIRQSLKSPVRIAIDKHDIVYVSDAFNKTIVKFNHSGEFIGTIEPGGSPVSIAINNYDQVFIGDGETGTILKLNEAGDPSDFYTKTLFPSSMVFSPDNLLYVVDSELKKVLVIDLSGNLIRTIGEGTFIRPTGIAFDPVNDWIYIAEHGGIGSGFKPKIKIWTFDTEGNLVRSVGSYGNGDGQFYRIQGLTVGKCGKIYATDPLLGTVSVFDKADFITKFGEYGKNPGQLNAPLDIVTDSGGQIWITSMNNSSVEVFKMNDSFPSSGISSTRTNICPGETTEIAVYFTGTAPWTFTYTKDDENPRVVNDVTDNPYIFSVSDAGLYKVTSLSDANYTATCNAGSVEINLNSLPTVNLGEDIHICEGEIFTLDAGAFTSYLWDDGSTDRTLKVNKSGNYSVMVLDSAGCENSAEVSVTVNPLPVSEFTYDDNYLEVRFLNTSTNADSYLWNFDDNEISQEANPVHIYKTSGEYNVTLTASNESCGESVFSKTIQVLGTIVENTGIENFAKVYPNPSSGIFNIEVNKPVRIDLIIEITNISGQKIYSKVFKTQKEVKQINLTGYPKGFYTIKFISKDFIKTEKIIISE